MLNCFELLHTPFLQAAHTEQEKSLYHLPYRQSMLSGISQPSGPVHKHLYKAVYEKRNQADYLANILHSREKINDIRRQFLASWSGKNFQSKAWLLQIT